MSNNKDFKVKNGIQPTVYHEGLGTVTSGSVGYYFTGATDTTNTLDISTTVGANPLSIRWKPDGLKLFVLSYTTDIVYTFTLTSAYDLNTATVDVTTYNFFTTEASNPLTIHFNNDGSKFYVPAYTSEKQVYQYSLSTPYDLGSESYDGAVTVSNVVYGIGAIAFKSDGTKAYFFDNYSLSNKIWQYDLSTAWDVTSTLSNEVTLDISGDLSASASDLLFSPDGYSFLVTNSSNIIQYNLSTAWDISTATQGISFDASSIDSSPRSPNYNSDGTRLFFSAASNREVRELNTSLNTNTLDLSTGSVFEITPTSDIQINLSNPADSGTVSQATLLLDQSGYGGYDLSNATDTGKAFAPTESSPYGIYIGNSGTKLYAVATADDIVYQYSLSTAYDISTASYDTKSFSVTSQDSFPLSIIFKPDGTKMYMGGNGTDRIYQYSLSTAWDISTASYDSVSFLFTSQDNQTNGIAFNDDGTKMYMLGGSSEVVFQYTLSTAYAVNTASYASKSFSTATQVSNGQSVTFNSSGTKMYICCDGTDAVYQYTLSTAWDVSTASYDSVSFSTGLATSIDLQWADDGSFFYVNGNTTITQVSAKSPATITYPSTLEWPSGTAPTSPALGETDVLTFSTRDGGTIYQAVQAIDGAK